ncbi:MAG: bifunctional phosphopantothenoylcysteine decarboxylase/phosphopantothenate--cysteine ligase CoaBC [Lachnospiraceae bacterium]|nr:bifunctional phosphopantothenoylcysteine decarboxylase/phosphopantothenate--cysteine ligase CoaBC [Lachnospiraceae bacterium]
MLQGKTVVLGVTGSIAAYKMANVASSLKKLHADVYVLMTKNATNFINPITFETLTGHKCLVDTFDRNFNFNIEHVSLAKKADYFLAAPASADVIGKMACGIADDMLTTTALACRCPVAVAPAMNTAMYENAIVQDNLGRLKSFGVTVIEPATGNLACGDTGKGKLPPEELLIAYICRAIACEKDFAGKRVLVTAGATRERLDPVRFLTNFSTGKMGCAAAKAAMLRGAEVTLVTGAATAEPPEFVNVVKTESAEDMYRAVMERREETDIFILSAAVADFRPEQVAEEKIKKSRVKESYLLPLVPTKDILKTLGETKRDGQYLCGFAMETEDLLARAEEKRSAKHADMICANSLREAGAGFGGDTNILTLITARGAETLPVMSKEACAHKILDRILEETKGVDA